MYFSIEVSEGFYGFVDPRYHLQMGLSESHADTRKCAWEGTIRSPE